MTPGARVAAAIEILDIHLDGMPVEKALTVWARGHRFAGSKDRAAIRDHVFDAIRRLKSSAAAGGAMTGRALMIGLLRNQDFDLKTLFHGEGYGPEPLTDAEQAPIDVGDISRADRLDCPEWLLPHFDASLGAQADATLDALRHRAPVFLRVNKARATRDEAQAVLAKDGIQTRPFPSVKMALEVTENPRKVKNSQGFLEGLVELQDVSSQAAVEALKIVPGMRVLDYCAGGGGKSLAMAAQGAKVVAHDIDSNRMKDIEERAKRAGCQIECVTSEELEQLPPFDIVFIDAPCSGSGSWRRAPHGKWLMTPERLVDLCEIQSDILSKIPTYLAQKGTIAYATCSVLKEENSAQIDTFISNNQSFKSVLEHEFKPQDGGDGFYVSLLHKN